MASEVGGARAFRCDFSGIITNCAIPLRRDSIAALEAWREECGREPCSPVFVNRHGRPLTHDSLAYLLNRNLEVARRNAPSLQGKRVTPHTLRHTAAMELLHNDVDRATIALWLGHESVETAYIYLHSDLQPKERAMARTSPLDLPVRTYRPDEAVPGLLNSLRLFRKNHTERPACQGLPKPFRNNRVPGIIQARLSRRDNLDESPVHFRHCGKESTDAGGHLRSHDSLPAPSMRGRTDDLNPSRPIIEAGPFERAYTASMTPAGCNALVSGR